MVAAFSGAAEHPFNPVCDPGDVASDRLLGEAMDNPAPRTVLAAAA